MTRWSWRASFERLREIGHWEVTLSNHPFMVRGNLLGEMGEHDEADGSGQGGHPVVQG